MAWHIPLMPSQVSRHTTHPVCLPSVDRSAAACELGLLWPMAFGAVSRAADTLLLFETSLYSALGSERSGSCWRAFLPAPVGDTDAFSAATTSVWCVFVWRSVDEVKHISRIAPALKAPRSKVTCFITSPRRASRAAGLLAATTYATPSHFRWAGIGSSEPRSRNYCCIISGVSFLSRRAAPNHCILHSPKHTLICRPLHAHSTNKARAA